MEKTHSAARSPGGLKILLCEGSSLSARHTLYALGKRHVIDVIDPSRLCQARFSRLVRSCRRCPSFAREPEGYLRFLARQLSAERYDVLFPTHDQVFLLSRFRDTLSRQVGLALPDFATLHRLQSKADFQRLLEELGLPHPRSRLVRSRAELEQTGEFPCYVKLPFSTAGAGVKFVRSGDELRSLAASLESSGQFAAGDEIMVQQPAKGVQATVQAVFQHGRLVGAHTFAARATGVGGMSTARESAVRPDVVEQVSRLGAHLHWQGAMFLDYFYDEATRQAEYIEANPRIGETVNAMLAGVNLCELLAEVSRGSVVEPVRPGAAGVRTHSGFMLLLTKALEGGTRRDLLDLSRQLRRQEGFFQDSQDELTRPKEDALSLVPAKAVAWQLLAMPRSAQSIVNRTVNNYALPHSAVDHIRQLPVDLMEGYFA